MPISGKTIQFTLDGNFIGQAVTDTSGTATYVYTIIQNSGTYTVLAEFLQDDIYASSNNTNNLVVDHTPTALVINPVGGFKGDKINLIATLTDTHSNVPISGKTIQFTVDGNIVGQAVTDTSGTATYVYNIIQNSGSFTVLADFFQDNVFVAVSNTTTLSVARTPTTLVINPIGGYKGDKINLIATLTDTHSKVPISGKTIQFTLDGNIVGQAVTDISGTATYVYTVIQNSGTYTILAQFVQDNVYAATINTNNLIVDHTPTTIIVNPVTGYKGDKVNLIATLTDTHSNVPVSGKTIQFSIDGNVVGQAITNASGIATYVYTILQNSGTYTLLTEFMQDATYTASSNTNNLIVDHTPTSLVVNPVTGFKGDKVNLIATLTDTHSNVPVSGKTIQFSIDGNIVGQSITDTSGTATYVYTVIQNSGTYTVHTEFSQDGIYASSNNTNNLVVNHTPTALVINPVSGFKGDKVNLIATLTDTHSNVPLIGKTIQFSVDGNIIGQAVTDASGTAAYVYTIIQNSGTYTVLAEFFQDDIYASSNNTNNLVVNHTPTTLVINPLSGYKGDKVNLIATLTDIHSNIPISGKTIQFTADGNIIGHAVTDTSGTATYVYTIIQNSGTYTVLADFFQDNVFVAVSNTTTLNVAHTPTSLVVNPVTGYKGYLVNLLATLTDTHSNVPISGKTIQFTVDGNIVGQTTTNEIGIASLPYSVIQNNGTYTVLAKFLQDVTYSASNNTNNLLVNRIPTSITVNTVRGFKGDVVDLIATLTDSVNKVPVADKTVNFIINGSPIGTAVTNSLGLATISDTVLQNGGTYTVQAVFLQDSIYASTSNTNNLIVDYTPTILVVNSVTGFKGDKINLIANLSDSHSNIPLSGKTIQFSVDKNIVGQAITDASGTATYTYTIIQNSGTYTVLTEFLQDITYASTSNTNNLTISITPTALVLNPAIGYKGKNIDLIATLIDTHSNVPISGKTIQFTVDGSSVGQATTNASGTATLSYTISQYTGTYSILAKFLQDLVYANCSNTNNCVVDNIVPTVSATPTGNYYNTTQVVTLKLSESGIIYYTLNGTNPTTSSTKYTGPLSISSTKTLKYLAIDLAGNKSPIYSQTYTVDKTAPKVSSTIPVSNVHGVPLTSSIYIKFNENIVAGSNYAKIYVKNLTTGKISTISKIISGTNLTIKTNTRTHKCIYQVYIPAGAIKDKAGNILTTAYSFKFVTA